MSTQSGSHDNMGERDKLEKSDMSDGEEAPKDRIRDVTGRLFGELGYDAVSTQMIADAAGFDTHTVADHYPSKAALYLDVLGRLQRLWTDQMASVFAGHEPAADSVITLMDRYLDFCLDHPEYPRLLMFRWMSDASDIRGAEEQILAPTVTESVKVASRIAAPGMDAEAAMWTLVWTIHGYLQAGFLDEAARPSPPEDPAMLNRFRSHLHELIRMLFAST
ncbi:TetR/AcrR family transcriptional regulator [Actinomadura sp. NPDC048394]|jgi:AcrR family transcriptional regulator|uniref:TetR/AcrR family transcriptional regulator n=1 Tax=Actinomadura sp. NPDC048394 TaxID=3158223 RepID=UPI0033E6FAA8